MRGDALILLVQFLFLAITVAGISSAAAYGILLSRHPDQLCDHDLRRRFRGVVLLWSAAGICGAAGAAIIGVSRRQIIDATYVTFFTISTYALWILRTDK